MTPEQIKIELYKRRRQVTCRQIARDLGVSHQAVYQVIERRFISLRIMDAVAAAIGRHRLEVFPETANTQPRPARKAAA